MKKTILFSLLLLFSIFSFAQFKFNLKNFLAGEESISKNTKQTLTIKNMLPNPKYPYTYKIDVVENTIPLFNKATSGLASGNCPSTSELTAFNDAYTNLMNVTSEDAVEGFVDALKTEMAKPEVQLQKGCIKNATALIGRTSAEIELTAFDLKDNQVITVSVIRTEKGKEPIKFTKIYKTPVKTKWLIHYGFTYQPNIVSKYDQFFSKQIPKTQDSFSITKMNGNQTKFWENLSPTIMFTYPFTKKERDIQFGFSAIASTNFSSFSAGAGMSAIIGYNVSIGTGVMFTQKNVLKGEYAESDIIRSNLNFDQLHSKKWGPEIYFTIGLRFDKNPFSGSATTDTTPTTAKSTTSK